MTWTVLSGWALHNLLDDESRVTHVLINAADAMMTRVNIGSRSLSGMGNIIVRLLVVHKLCIVQHTRRPDEFLKINTGKNWVIAAQAGDFITVHSCWDM